MNSSVMQAQPVLASFFNGPRAYVINISQVIYLGKEEINIRDMPHDVLVGWVGHELGHIMDYTTRGMWSMIRFGIGYLLSGRYIKSAEWTADNFAIQHGLADKIMATKNYILNHAHLTDKYKRKIKRLYMSPEEVLELAEAKSGF